MIYIQYCEILKQDTKEAHLQSFNKLIRNNKIHYLQMYIFSLVSVIAKH